MSIKKNKRYLLVAWLICGLGAVFYSYEYFLRISPSVMEHALRTHFNLSATGFGLLSAFYYYARDVIKGRWKEAEDTITGIYMFCYAMNVIKGKLPDKMHNMMLLDAIENPNSLHVKSYFEFINK